MKPLKHRIKTKLIQTSAELEKRNLRGDWLACLLWHYGNRARFVLKKRSGIVLTVDHAEFMENRIGVAGWALSSKGDAGIQRIEVYLDDALLGNAVYGDARGDVEHLYPFLKQSRYAGFHFYADVRNGNAYGNGHHAIKVRVIGRDGRIHQKFKSLTDTYALWIKRHEPNISELEQQRQTTFASLPRISLITPVYNTPCHFLSDMLESVRNQTYPHWELCLVDGASEIPEVKEIITRYAKQDARIKVTWLPENKGIAGNSNVAFAMATGDFVGLLDHDDTLAPFALFEVVKYLNTHQTDYLYSDEDRLSEDGTMRYDPYFKPDWSPDTLRSTNYPTHFSVFRKNLLDRIGWFREGFEGSQDYDLILRITEHTKAISHIAKVLYHWRMHNASLARDARSKSYAYFSAQKALQEHLERIHLPGTVEETELLGYYKITYRLARTPTISIIIPNRDHADILKQCINSIVRKSHYRHFEILVIENGSQEKQTALLYDHLKADYQIRILEWKQPSFNYAAINNFGAMHAHGEVLLFLNNDTEVISVDWLERMLEHAMREHVGAVGAKLYYPDQTIQHAGIIIGMTGVAGYSHKYLPGYTPGYRGWLRIVHNISAVTGACLMIRRSIFDEAGGFNEQFAYAFNDVDLCLRVRTLGYLNVWTPYAELYHHESATRGLDATPVQHAQFDQEQVLFAQQWRQILAFGDPYYNRNLSLEREDFSIRQT
jgi:O-antigen biosynthesis protein